MRVRFSVIVAVIVAIVTGLTSACQPPPPGPSTPEPTTVAPSSSPLAELAPATQPWPRPVPTVYEDGALSIRGLQLDPEPLLAGAAAGEVVRMRLLVQGPEPATGAPRRTWCVDRALDLERLDLGVPVEPPLLGSESSEPIVLVARLERRPLDDEGEPTLVLATIAWSTDAGATWRDAAGTALLEPSWPRETSPSPLLVRAAQPVPHEQPASLARARELLELAALADEGELAEGYARRAIELAPDDVELWSTLIAIEHGYGQHEAHLAALAAARARGLTELDGLWLDYGRLDVTIGEPRHALALLERAIELEPESLAAHFYHATAHWLLGDHEAARPGYRRVVELAEARHGASALEFRMIETAHARLAQLDAESDR